MSRPRKSSAAGAELEAARAAKAKLARIAPDAAIGLTRAGGRFAIKVNLRQPLAAGESLPREIDGVPVKTEVVGPIRKR